MHSHPSHSESPDQGTLLSLGRRMASGRLARDPRCPLLQTLHALTVTHEIAQLAADPTIIRPIEFAKIPAPTPASLPHSRVHREGNEKAFSI
jgi:hypothetical protein